MVDKFQFANSKAFEVKSAAAFPDPCWSPPGPATGPVVVPYPNTAHAKTLSKGTATVFICNSMVATEDKSYFASSEGDDGATDNFPKGVATNAKNGKAYFQTWSKNVFFEGFGVPRHEDLMTHNHGSNPGDTPVTYYMDSTNSLSCQGDKKAIEKECKPEPPHDEKDKNKPRKKKGGLIGKLTEATEVLDDLGKATFGYKRDITSKTAIDGNAWMEDHCSGMWSLPNPNNAKDFQDKIQGALEKLDNFDPKMDALGAIKDIALEVAKDQAEEIFENFLLKAGIKIATGTVLGETVIVPILMGAWTASDIYSTGKELAALAGDKGKAALDALENIRNLDKKAKELLTEYATNPVKAQADGMALYAGMNPCLRARKCALAPYENSKNDKNKEKGNGCCPGQTAHHVIPDSAVKDSDCPGYDYDKAPTMCLEGTRNHEGKNGGGTHGSAHIKLAEKMDGFTEKGKTTLKYEDYKKEALDAIQEVGIFWCNRKCLEKQLDEHYKCSGKDLKTVSGAPFGK